LNFRNRYTIFLATMILAGTLSVAGCAKTGMQRSAKAGTTMQTVENDIKQVISQVDITGASLQDLIRPGQPDAKKAFKKYTANVEKMEGMEKRFFEHTDKMRVQGKEYFEEWRTDGNTYTNPQIQALGEQRRADLSADFVRISEASVGVKGSFNAYMSDLKEIQNYLSNDLTPKGVEAISPIAQQAVMDGTSLQAAIYPVLNAVSNARGELTQGGTK
jgi:hypothetical protein